MQKNRELQAANAVNVAQVGAFDRDEREGIGEKEVAEFGLADDALAGLFEDGFLLGPQASEGHVGTRSTGDLEQFGVVHHITGHLGIVCAHRFYIDANGAVVCHTDDGLVAMTQVEMDFGMGGKIGLAMLTIAERGGFLDAILFAQDLTEEQIGGCTLDASQRLTIAQSLLASPVGKLGQGGFEVEGLEVGVEEDGHSRV